MDPESKKESVTDPRNTPSSEKKSERPSSDKKKEKKRKKSFRIPPQLLGSIWWIATIATFTIGAIGLVKIILQIYLRGSPDWDYALIINPLPWEVEMAVYGFKGPKRDLTIRHVENVGVGANLERDGIRYEFRKAFERAVRIIPWISRSRSPVIFAGGGDMRLMRKYDKNKYNLCMSELYQLLKNSPLKYLPQSLRTLNEWEEPLYGWIALNYLSDYMIKGRQPIKAVRDIFTTTMTSGGLDLGKTSLHISYEIPRVLDHIQLEDGVKENTRVITLYGRVYFIYTKTLPCYGEQRLIDMYQAYKLKGRSFMGYRYWEDTSYKDMSCIITDLSIERVTGHLLRTCCYSEFAKRFVDRYGYGSRIYMYGPSNADKCLTEVKAIVDDCRIHFKNNDCPTFKFPKRPYNVTFTVFNEFAIYAQLARLKNGDSKNTWDKRRKKICNSARRTVLEQEFPHKNIPEWRSRYHSLCLIITYLYYFLSEKLNLSSTEWSRLRIAQEVDQTKISWYLGYVANITNSLPTSTAFYGEVSIEDLLAGTLIFTSILSISSVTVAFALRNSNVLALRPLQLPQ